MTFQELILALNKFWSDRGCVIQQPYDLEVGAGTFNPATFLRVLGPEPYSVAYVEPSRRPTDGRYGENPNRLQHYYQYQVILKAFSGRFAGNLPGEPQELWASTLWITISALSKTTGNRPHWAPRVWAGKFGSMGWR